MILIFVLIIVWIIFHINNTVVFKLTKWPNNDGQISRIRYFRLTLNWMPPAHIVFLPYVIKRGWKTSSHTYEYGW